MALPEGTITWNAKKQDFIAVCKHPDHPNPGGCRRTRTSTGGRKIAQGRPLGYLVAWLRQQGSFGSSEEHKVLCTPSFAERCEARVALRAMGGIAEELLSHERALRPDEGEEPTDCP